METLENSGIDDATRVIEELLRPSPVVIGIDGGPAGGKTTVLKKVADSCQGLDRKVVIIPEVATEVISDYVVRGVDVNYLRRHDREAYLNFEAQILCLINEKIKQQKENNAGTNAIIVVDRTDIGGYIEPADHKQVLTRLGLTQPPHLSLVDKILYLPTVARYKPELYGDIVKNNNKRLEPTAEQAVDQCNRNFSSIGNHPEVSYYFDDNFEAMVSRVVNSILSPEVESEVKYVPELSLGYQGVIDLTERITEDMPKEVKLGRLVMQQSYHSLNGVDFRLRYVQVNSGGHVIYFCVKNKVGQVTTEHQRIITYPQYRALYDQSKKEAETSKERMRYIHRLGSRYTSLVLDYYPQPINRFTLEIENATKSETSRYLPSSRPRFKRSNLSAKKLIETARR